ALRELSRRQAIDRRELTLCLHRGKHGRLSRVKQIRRRSASAYYPPTFLTLQVPPMVRASVFYAEKPRFSGANGLARGTEIWPNGQIGATSSEKKFVIRPKFVSGFEH